MRLAILKVASVGSAAVTGATIAQDPEFLRSNLPRQRLQRRHVDVLWYPPKSIWVEYWLFPTEGKLLKSKALELKSVGQNEVR